MNILKSTSSSIVLAAAALTVPALGRQYLDQPTARYPHSAPSALTASRDGEILYAAEGTALFFLDSSVAGSPPPPPGELKPSLPIGLTTGARPIVMMLDPDAPGSATLKNGNHDPAEFAYMATSTGLYMMEADAGPGLDNRAVLLDACLVEDANDPNDGQIRRCVDVGVMTIDGTDYLLALHSKKDDSRLRVYDLAQVRSNFDRTQEAGNEVDPIIAEIVLGRHPEGGLVNGAGHADMEDGYSFAMALDVEEMHANLSYVYVVLAEHGLVRVRFAGGNFGPNPSAPDVNFGPIFGDGTPYADQRPERYGNIDYRYPDGPPPPLNTSLIRSDRPYFMDLAVQHDGHGRFLYVALDARGWCRFALAPSWGHELPIDHHEGVAVTTPWDESQFNVLGLIDGSGCENYTYVRRCQYLGQGGPEGGPVFAISYMSTPTSITDNLTLPGYYLNHVGSEFNGVPIELFGKDPIFPGGPKGTRGNSSGVIVYDVTEGFRRAGIKPKTGGSLAIGSGGAPGGAPSAGPNDPGPGNGGVTPDPRRGGRGQSVLLSGPEDFVGWSGGPWTFPLNGDVILQRPDVEGCVALYSLSEYVSLMGGRDQLFLTTTTPTDLLIFTGTLKAVADWPSRTAIKENERTNDDRFGKLVLGLGPSIIEADVLWTGFNDGFPNAGILGMCRPGGMLNGEIVGISYLAGNNQNQPSSDPRGSNGILWTPFSQWLDPADARRQFIWGGRNVSWTVEKLHVPIPPGDVCDQAYQNKIKQDWKGFVLPPRDRFDERALRFYLMGSVDTAFDQYVRDQLGDQNAAIGIVFASRPGSPEGLVMLRRDRIVAALEADNVPPREIDVDLVPGAKIAELVTHPEFNNVDAATNPHFLKSHGYGRSVFTFPPEVALIDGKWIAAVPCHTVIGEGPGFVPEPGGNEPDQKYRDKNTRAMVRFFDLTNLDFDATNSDLDTPLPEIFGEKPDGGALDIELILDVDGSDYCVVGDFGGKVYVYDITGVALGTPPTHVATHCPPESLADDLRNNVWQVSVDRISDQQIHVYVAAHRLGIEVLDFAPAAGTLTRAKLIETPGSPEAIHIGVDSAGTKTMFVSDTFGGILAFQ